jgi:putative flippase GtrA
LTPLVRYLRLLVKNDSAIQIAANAMVVGVLLHVSTTILFESNSNHKLKINNLIAIVSAFVIGYFL